MNLLDRDVGKRWAPCPLFLVSPCPRRSSPVSTGGLSNVDNFARYLSAFFSRNATPVTDILAFDLYTLSLSRGG